MAETLRPKSSPDDVRRAIEQATKGAPKYPNEAVTIDGYRFDSKGEAARYQELKNLQRAGKVFHLIADKTQLRYPLVVNGEVVGVYEGDFSYTLASGECILEDFKGHRTAVYKLKRKLFKACYGFDITETN